MKFLRATSAVALVVCSCTGPDLNLGDSNGAPGGASAGGSGNASAGGASGQAGGGAAGSGATAGTSYAGTGGSPTALPLPTIERISFSRSNPLHAVYVGTDRSIWVGDDQLHKYDGGGTWGGYVDVLGEDIADLWGDAERPTYAAGSQDVYAYDGTIWNSMATLGCAAPLRLSVTSSHVYAACNSGTGVVHRIGRDAGAMNDPAAAKTSLSSAVWAFSDAKVVALTGRVDSDGALGLLTVFTGGTWNADASWQDQKVARAFGAQKLIRDFWSSDGQTLLIVGDGGIVVRGQGSSWLEEPTTTVEALNAVWGSPETGDFAVGNNGTVLFFDRARWHELPSGTAVDLHAIHGQPNGPVVAVGDAGTVLRIVP